MEFPSEGAVLRGMLFRPDSGTTKPPVVIMAHGTSATVTMVTDEYARVFARTGLAVLLYDHRNIGRSGGEPRQEINPWVQARGYRDAMNFVETREDLDSGRIALWGDSYSGGEVVVVGAIDTRVHAVVAQCPAFGAEPPSIEPTRGHFETLKETFLHGDVRGSPATTVGPIPVVSFDQAAVPSLMTPIQAFRWFIDYGGRHGTHWVNRVIRVTPATPVPFHAVLAAPFVTVPTLLMVAPEDEMALADYTVAKRTYDLLAGPKEWYDIEGGHFGLLFYPSGLFDEASGVQARFLEKWLQGGPP